MKLQMLVATVLIGWSGWSAAASTQPMYAQVSAHYNEADAPGVKQEGTGFGLAYGYEFHRQWYVEVGYQQLMDESLDNVVTIADTDTDLPQGMEARGGYLAVLGKATSSQGTLFYRFGVMALDRETEYYASVDAGCDAQSSGTTVATVTQCVSEDTSAAGMAGLGFDFNLSPNWALRTEYQYVRGQDDFESHGALIGVQYHF